MWRIILLTAAVAVTVAHGNARITAFPDLKAEAYKLPRSGHKTSALSLVGRCHHSEWDDEGNCPTIVAVGESSGDARTSAYDVETRQNAYLNSNGLLTAIFKAYGKHHNLVIRPDDFWIAVQVSFARYVEGNAEALRDRFVEHEGQKELRILTPYGFTEIMQHIDEFTSEFTRMIASAVRDPSVLDWIVPDFSTTTALDRTVGGLTVMATHQRFFGYFVDTLCGIPEIELEGTLEDWQHVTARVARLTEFEVAGRTEMAAWRAQLEYVLAHFVRAYDTTAVADLAFWQRICSDEQGGSGEPDLYGGWSMVFSPFDADGRFQYGDASPARWHRSVAPADVPWLKLTESQVTSGVVKFPLTITDEVGFERACTVYAGHASYDVEHREVDYCRPRVDWFISYTVPKEDVQQLEL